MSEWLKSVASKVLKNTRLVTPKTLGVLRYRRKFNRKPDLKNPKDLNEKIMWLMYNTDTNLWTELADKYLVRKFIESKGLGDWLVGLYGVYDNADDIDFDSLPESFVIKTNNGYGTVLQIADKSKIDSKQLKKDLNKWIKRPFGYLTAEPHYVRIKPRIVIEELLNNDSETSSSLIDYKFWCFDGEIYCCFVCGNRNIERHTTEFVPYHVPQWVCREDILHENYRTGFRANRPKNLEKMMEGVKKLAQGFPQVRVDLYEAGGKIYFGEMTFTSNAGRMRYFTDEALLEMGNLITLPALTGKER